MHLSTIGILKICSIAVQSFILSTRPQTHSCYCRFMFTLQGDLISSNFFFWFLVSPNLEKLIFRLRIEEQSKCSKVLSTLILGFEGFQRFPVFDILHLLICVEDWNNLLNLVFILNIDHFILKRNYLLLELIYFRFLPCDTQLRYGLSGCILCIACRQIHQDLNS